jgi:hypothetical protein
MDPLEGVFVNFLTSGFQRAAAMRTLQASGPKLVQRMETFETQLPPTAKSPHITGVGAERARRGTELFASRWTIRARSHQLFDILTSLKTTAGAAYSWRPSLRAGVRSSIPTTPRPYGSSWKPPERPSRTIDASAR